MTYIKKGYARGERAKRSTLTDDAVRQMRVDFETPCPHCGKNPTLREMAEKHGISHVAVLKIIQRKSWTHVL